MEHGDWRSNFERDGFALFRGAVPEGRVALARRAIGLSLEASASAGRGPSMSDAHHCPELARDPALLGLLQPVRANVDVVFGERTHGGGAYATIRRAALAAIGRIRGERAQIALRFPDGAPSGDPRFGLHLDGYPTRTNGLPKRRLFRSTVLVGVYLTDVLGPDRGNFVVWPGSHRRYARFFRDLDAPRFLAEHGAEALLERIRAFDAGDPVQLEVRAGDAVIAHHLLGHGTADNLSTQTREAVYFRMVHPEDRVSDPAPLLDEKRFFGGIAWERERG